jgi:hypothetical protein
MAVKHRLADLSYRIYDRSRHASAFEAAGRAGTASDFDGFADQKYGGAHGEGAAHPR